MEFLKHRTLKRELVSFSLDKTIKSKKVKILFDEEIKYINLQIKELISDETVLKFLRSIPPAPTVEISLLPTKSENYKYTLVLDLDETLVHSKDVTDIQSVFESDFVVEIPTGKSSSKRSVRKRPHLDNFLLEAAKDWELIIFTGGLESYANQIIDTIDPDQALISHILCRDYCYIKEKKYIKNLNILNRDLTKTIILDNSIESFGFQLDNGLLIRTWTDDPQDDQLLIVLKILQKIAESNCSNIKDFLDKHFGLKKSVHNQN